MNYIVKNCPALVTGWNDKDYICNTHQMGCGHCKDCTDCVIKRVIDKCKHFKSALDYDKGSVFVAQEILNMFDIEEVRE